MPVRNVIRIQTADSYFHVYNRGHNRSWLFEDEDDYAFFEFLLQRCFGPHQLSNKEGNAFPWFGDEVQLQAFCLMSNHFHLLLYQTTEAAISKAMQSLATTYSMYFNKKYKRRGSIFESVFKSSPLMSDSYLRHITRYIHLNPNNYKQWHHSSYQDYRSAAPRIWIGTEPVLELFDSKQQYLDFVDDYAELNDKLSELKFQLADYGETYQNTKSTFVG